MGLFKSKVTLITEKWEVIEVFRSDFKPSVDEFIYSKKNECYYQVRQVIHSLKDKSGLLLVVKEIKFEQKDELS